MAENFAKAEAKRKAGEVYRITQQAASTNSIIQATSGVFGAGWNLTADVAVLPLYIGIWNDIRNIYGQGTITPDEGLAFLRTNLTFFIEDLVMDKILGSIPIVGIPINYTYARALTWRLGAFFGLMAAMGKNPSDEALGAATIHTIGTLFKNKNLKVWETLTFQHKAPDRDVFVDLLVNYENIVPVDASETEEDTQK